MNCCYLDDSEFENALKNVRALNINKDVEVTHYVGRKKFKLRSSSYIERKYSIVPKNSKFDE